MLAKYLVTDMDGVIFDRMPLYRKTFGDCLFACGVLREISERYYYDTLGMPLRFQIQGVLARQKIEAGEDKINELVKNYWEMISGNDVKLFPGVKEVLDELKNEGIGILASSGSSTGELKHLIGKFNLPYDLLLGSDELPKGDEHIKIFAKNYFLDKEDFCRQAVFLGDGTVDMEIARRNGIFGIGITNTLPEEKLISAGAQAVIENICQLPEILKTINYGKF